MPIDTEGSYEIIGRFKSGSEIHRFLTVGPRNESGVQRIAAELVTKFNAHEAAFSQVEAVEALCHVDAPQAIPELETILSNSQLFDQAIFKCLANDKRDAGIEALLRFLSFPQPIANKDRQFFALQALRRRRSPIGNSDLAWRVMLASADRWRVRPW